MLSKRRLLHISRELDVALSQNLIFGNIEARHHATAVEAITVKSIAETLRKKLGCPC